MAKHTANISPSSRSWCAVGRNVSWTFARYDGRRAIGEDATSWATGDAQVGH